MSMPPIVMNLSMFRGDYDQARSQLSLLWLMEAHVRINQSHIRLQRGLARRGMGRPIPPIYRAGVHYEREQPVEIEPGLVTAEEWPDIPKVLGKRGLVYPGPWADCEDLADWRTAELRELPFHFARPAVKGKKRIVVCMDPRYPQPGTMKERKIVGKIDGAPIHAWRGFRVMKGGIKAKPFAKWRRNPATGSFHYHALVLLPYGAIEDPSLVLGMGREPEFAAREEAERMRVGILPVVLRYSSAPSVVVVDPEKPSGYGV
jgi:hypothetical protein